MRPAAAALTVLMAIVLAAAAGPSTADTGPVAHYAASCSGTIKEKVGSKTVRARSIKVRRTTCRGGRKVVRTFLRKADASSRCNSASKKPPPTSGCRVLGYNCFRNGSTYCATPGGKSVSWKE